MSIAFIKSIYYELISYFIPQKVKYEIQGNCIKCGKCCKEIRIYGMENEKDLKLMQLIFPWYKIFYIIKKDENENIVLGCKKQKDDGTCSIYKWRPFVCRNYPKKSIYHNAEMLEGCGFKVNKKQFKDYL